MVEENNSPAEKEQTETGGEEAVKEKAKALEETGK